MVAQDSNGVDDELLALKSDFNSPLLKSDFNGGKGSRNDGKTAWLSPVETKFQQTWDRI